MNREKLFARLDAPRLDDLLADWRWLIQGDVLLVAVTAMGHMILRKGNRSVWFLDTIEGTYRKIANDEDGYQEVLADRDFRRKYLQYYCVLNLVEAGIELDTNQCYSPDIPPHFGGQIDETNLKPTDIYVHFSMSGQIWKQTKDLKPGTKFTGIEIVTPEKKTLVGRLFGFLRR